MAKTYTTVQGDMWDGIAKRLYGTEAGINELIKANEDYVSTVVFPSGVVLMVPEYKQNVSVNIPPWRR